MQRSITPASLGRDGRGNLVPPPGLPVRECVLSPVGSQPLLERATGARPGSDETHHASTRCAGGVLAISRQVTGRANPHRAQDAPAMPGLGPPMAAAISRRTGPQLARPATARAGPG